MSPLLLPRWVGHDGGDDEDFLDSRMSERIPKRDRYSSDDDDGDDGDDECTRGL